MANKSRHSHVTTIPEYVDVTIANGAQEANAINLGGKSLVGIFIPAAFTGTTISFKVASAENGTYVAVYKDDGTLYQPSVGASRYVPLDPSQMVGAQFVKVVSGSAEGAARTLTLALRVV